MKDIIALCNRDKEDYGIENDQVVPSQEATHKRDPKILGYVNDGQHQPIYTRKQIRMD